MRWRERDKERERGRERRTEIDIAREGYVMVHRMEQAKALGEVLGERYRAAGIVGAPLAEGQVNPVVCVGEGVCDRQTDRQREGDRDRRTDRQTDRYTDRQTEGVRETDRGRETETEIRRRWFWGSGTALLASWGHRLLRHR